jgi:hypothetical protein
MPYGYEGFFMAVVVCYLQKRTCSVRQRTVYTHAAVYNSFVSSNFCFGMPIEYLKTGLATIGLYYFNENNL